VADADTGGLQAGGAPPSFSAVSMRGAAQSNSAATAAKGRYAAERLRVLQEQRAAEAAGRAGAGAEGESDASVLPGLAMSDSLGALRAANN